MSKELNLEIYDIVKIMNGVGSIWIESISKMDKENYYTKGFKIDKQGNVESLYIKNINDAYQLEFVWRLDDNRNYIMIYPIQRLEAIDKKRCGANVEKIIIDEFVPGKAIENANPSEALNCIEKVNDYLSDVYDYKEIIEEVQRDINTIKQALLKAQEQEKVIIELCEYCGMDNLYPYDNLEEIEITFKDTFDNYQLQRITSLGRLNNLENENTELKRVLEIMSKKLVSIFQLGCCKNVDEYNDLKFNEFEKLTQEEFDLLKRWIENENI